MKITILVDNTPGCGCCAEWGLAAYIETEKNTILLDTGASALFIENAEKLGKDLKTVDFAVLSHAHFDHAGGFNEFFEINRTAPLYLAADARENCFTFVNVRHHYIGIPRGTMEAHPDRLSFCSGVTQIADNAWTITHSSPNLDRIGEKNKMYLREGRRYRADDFSHEQTLAVDEGDGIVIFNSCSHSGPDVILNEVQAAFPGRPVKAYFGGLHLYKRTTAEISEIAGIFARNKIKAVYTGHCTGSAAFDRLERELGDVMHKISTGLVIEL